MGKIFSFILCFFLSSLMTLDNFGSATAQAVDYTPSYTYPEYSKDSFDTPNEAAVKAIALSYAISNEYEYGGIIYINPDGSYGFSYPKTNYSNDSVYINHFKHPYGVRVVANYHTHPCLPYTHFPRFFSPQDTTLGYVFNVNVYMGDLCSGRVNLFDKMSDMVGNILIKNDQGETVDALTSGNVIGQIFLSKRPIIVENKPPFVHISDELIEQMLKPEVIPAS